MTAGVDHTAVKAFLADLEGRDRGFEMQAYGDQPGTTYRGAEIGRLTRNWLPPNVSGDDAIGAAWPLLTARIRDQLRNDPLIAKARRVLTDHVVGTGVMTFAGAMISADDQDDEFNFESDDAFEYWCEHEADVTGRLSHYDQQRLLMNEVASSGEALLLTCTRADRNRSAPLCYQVLEAEQIDDTIDGPARGPTGNDVFRGVEVDALGQPVAYYLWDAHPFDSHARPSSNSTRVDARRVRHVFLQDRPSQHRGVSWFATIMQCIRDLDWYVGNELTAAAIGALLTVMITRDPAGNKGTGFAGPDGQTTDEYGNPLFRLGRGTVFHGGPNDKAEVIESKRPNSQAEPWIRLMMQLGGMGIGVSYLRLTGDYSRTNYSSARGAHLDDSAFFRPLQNWFGRQVCVPVRQEFNRTAVATGLIRTVSPQQFLRQQRRWQRMQTMPVGREQLDPPNETDAAAARIHYNFSTLERECGALGRNWLVVMRQRRREIRLARRLGVPLDFSPRRVLPTAAPAEPNARDQQQDADAEARDFLGDLADHERRAA